MPVVEVVLADKSVFATCYILSVMFFVSGPHAQLPAKARLRVSLKSFQVEGSKGFKGFWGSRGCGALGNTSHAFKSRPPNPKELFTRAPAKARLRTVFRVNP